MLSNEIIDIKTEIRDKVARIRSIADSDSFETWNLHDNLLASGNKGWKEVLQDVTRVCAALDRFLDDYPVING